MECPWDDDALAGGEAAFQALMGADESWKEIDITVPLDLFDADMIDELEDAGFEIIEQ